MSSLVSRRVLHGLFVLLLVVVVAPFVVYAAPWVVGADASFIVLTASMTPAIEPGDVVIVGETEPSAIQEGDVITFTRGEAETPVTHRVVGLTEADGDVAFETKGDANENPDEGLVSGENVIGTVVFTIPLIGYVVQFVNSPYGFIALVVLPILLFVLNEIWMLVKAGTEPAPSSTSSATAEYEPTPEPDVNPPAESNPPSETQKTAAAPPSERTGVTLTATDLSLTAFVLFAFGVYAIYTVTLQFTAITVGVAFGVVMTLVLAIALRMSVARSGGVSSSESAGETTKEDATESEPTATTDGGVDPVEAAAPRVKVGDRSVPSASSSDGENE